MSDKTHIQWCDATFNPWIGCTKVSPGCANCYAENNAATRLKGAKWGKGQERHRTSETNWELPHRWNRAAVCREGLRRSDEAPLHRLRVFCASLADWLDDEVPIEWLADLLKLIHATPNLDWLLLTKRPENFAARVESLKGESLNREWLDGKAPANVWFGVSVEDQARAEERIPVLLEIPARVRFLSVEPLLGPVDLKNARDLTVAATGIDWVIVGGESGPKARPCNVESVRSIVRQCKAAGVPCFVKQLGSNALDPTGFPMALKHPKGGEPSEWPEDLRVREFPAFA